MKNKIEDLGRYVEQTVLTSIESDKTTQSNIAKIYSILKNINENELDSDEKTKLKEITNNLINELGLEVHSFLKSIEIEEEEEEIIKEIITINKESNSNN
jgi:hypothetical protein